MGAVGDAWEKLFDETIAGLTFDIEGEDLNIEATLNLLTEQDRSKREMAARELARIFGENIRTFARVHNTQAKEKDIIDRWRMACQHRKQGVTYPTMSRPKWSKRCVMRSWPPTQS